MTDPMTLPEDTHTMDNWLQALENETDAAEGDAYVVLGRAGSQVAVVTLSRPQKRNPLSLRSWVRLEQIFEDLAQEPELRSVVIRGAGVEAFGAGADITEFVEKRMTAADAVQYNESIARALRAVGALGVPVIAMVRGLAVGGGCELAAACDVRICADDARFGIPIGRLGVTLGYTETKTLVGLIGRANLKRLLFEGDLIDAQEAMRVGLVQVCVAPDELTRRTAAMLDAIIASAPVTMRAAKLVTDMCDRELTDADAELLTRITVEAYEGPHLREGVQAFLERRSPNFGQEHNDVSA
jgi:enoyl-CoA hydratase